MSPLWLSAWLIYCIFNDLQNSVAQCPFLLTFHDESINLLFFKQI